MSFENLKVTGEVKSEETVKRTLVNAEEISVDCGNETLTFRGKITEILRKARVSTGAAVRVDLPDGSSKFISSLDSPELYNADGSEKAAPAEAKYTPVYSGKAAQELLPEEEKALEEAREEDKEDIPTEVSVDPAQEETV